TGKAGAPTRRLPAGPAISRATLSPAGGERGGVKGRPRASRPACHGVRAAALRRCPRERALENTRSSFESERAPEHGLRPEPHAEPLLDARAHSPRKRDDIARARPIVADDGQGVPAGETHGPVGLAALEARTLDQPGRGELDAAVGLGPARQR